MQTKVTILVQVLLGGGLHRMMKGAYNSGIVHIEWCVCVCVHVVFV